MNELIKISRALCSDVNNLKFALPVTHIYNPLDYAQKPLEVYIKRFGTKSRDVILVGMNPGPFGMAQTGVPFGDVKMTRDFLGIYEKVGKPKKEHPKRPVDGFDCKRSEVSGTRVWTFVKEKFETPQKFFKNFYVLNYCPLVFTSQTGKNITPDKLLADERSALYKVCDVALQKTVVALKAKHVVGIGAFAEKRCKEILGHLDVKIGRILHPSPASPVANRGWAAQAEKQLVDLGLL